MWREFSVGPFIFTKENLEYGKLLERGTLEEESTGGSPYKEILCCFAF